MAPSLRFFLLASLFQLASARSVLEDRRLREALQRLQDVPLPKVAKVAGAVTLASAAPSAVVRAKGLLRGLRFWKHVLPIYLEYRRTERRVQSLGEEERHRCWQSLHVKHAPHVLDMILDLRGFYVKLGQVCSTRSDMFPKPWLEKLETLQGSNPELLAKDSKAVRRMLHHELGGHIREIVDMEDEPLGAAATGQVHRAWLQDGREVAVKLQYPEAARLFRQDFANTKLFCRLLQPEHLAYIEELEAQFATEFDYRREAEDLATVSANFREGIGNPYAHLVRIPEPVMELSTRRVVVMEFLPGQTLLSYGRKKKAELERSSWLSMLWNGWRLRREMQAYLTLLINVQGYQIFIDGVFNGDPHPGNVLRMPDGRLGLIDYGNVKHLDLEQRALLARVIIALAEGSKEAVCKAATELGFETQKGDQDVLFRYASLWFDRDDGESIVLPNGELPGNIQVYLEKLSEIDPLTSTPEGYLMAARNSFLMRGLGTHLGIEVRTAVRWRSFAEAALQAANAAASSSGGERAFVYRRSAGMRGAFSGP